MTPSNSHNNHIYASLGNSICYIRKHAMRIVEALVKESCVNNITYDSQKWAKPIAMSDT